MTGDYLIHDSPQQCKIWRRKNEKTNKFHTPSISHNQHTPHLLKVKTETIPPIAKSLIQGAKLYRRALLSRAGNPDIPPYITNTPSTSQATVNFQSPTRDHRLVSGQDRTGVQNINLSILQSVSDTEPWELVQFCSWPAVQWLSSSHWSHLRDWYQQMCSEVGTNI